MCRDWARPACCPQSDLVPPPLLLPMSRPLASLLVLSAFVIPSDAHSLPHPRGVCFIFHTWLLPLPSEPNWGGIHQPQDPAGRKGERVSEGSGGEEVSVLVGLDRRGHAGQRRALLLPLLPLEGVRQGEHGLAYTWSANNPDG